MRRRTTIRARKRAMRRKRAIIRRSNSSQRRKGKHEKLYCWNSRIDD
jgi:hypothetical protein